MKNGKMEYEYLILYFIILFLNGSIALVGQTSTELEGSLRIEEGLTVDTLLEVEFGLLFLNGDFLMAANSLSSMELPFVLTNTSNTLAGLGLRAAPPDLGSFDLGWVNGNNGFYGSNRAFLFSSSDFGFFNHGGELMSIGPFGLELYRNTLNYDHASLNDQEHYSWMGSDLDFTDPSTGEAGQFLLASKGGTDGSGIVGNGAGITMWSPADEQGGIFAHLAILDEDFIHFNDTDPYNNNALILYLNTSGMWQTSDSRKKINKIRITQAGAILNSITGYKYDFIQPEDKKSEKQKNQVIGLMAQELEKVLPEAVQKSDYGDYFINYSMLLPVIIEAFKEQQEEINLFKSILKDRHNNLTEDRMEDLEQELRELKLLLNERLNIPQNNSK